MSSFKMIQNLIDKYEIGRLSHAFLVETNNIDLYSRLVIFLARTKDESFFLNFLKKNKIKDVSLYIKDFDFLTYENKQKQLFPKQEKRYQIADILIDKRFITSLNYLYAENKIMLLWNLENINTWSVLELQK